MKMVHPITGFGWWPSELESNLISCGWLEHKSGEGLIVTIPMDDESAQMVLQRGFDSGQLKAETELKDDMPL